LQTVQQQVHYLQQLLQILPQQLHQVAHLAQTLSHQVYQQPFSAPPIQLPNVAAFGPGLSQHPAAIPPQNFGYAAQPGQLM
jgi:hypothetical protein